ncbi:MAG: hypothetical protein JWP89_4807 [Schlesneria sp.]|nr:hypothetical protein [Schlesneria sp.]
MSKVESFGCTNAIVPLLATLLQSGSLELDVQMVAQCVGRMIDAGRSLSGLVEFFRLLPVDTIDGWKSDLSLLGSHLSSAGGMHNAAEKAAAFDMDAVQIFMRCPSQSVVKPVNPAEKQTPHTGGFERR